MKLTGPASITTCAAAWVIPNWPVTPTARSWVTHYEDRGLPLTAWLFHLARDQAANIRRRAGRFVPLEAGDTEHDGDPETLLALQWDWEHLQYVLTALPDHYRRVL